MSHFSYNIDTERFRIVLKLSRYISILHFRNHVRWFFNDEKAKNEMKLRYIRANNSDLPLDFTLKLFDHTIVPILT